MEPLGFKTRWHGGEPGGVEFVIGVGAAGFVPFAFVDGDHFAGVAGDAAVGEEVGRVGEDEVDGGFGDVLQGFRGSHPGRCGGGVWGRRRRELGEWRGIWA